MLPILVAMIVLSGSNAFADWVADVKSPVTTKAKWTLLSGTALTLVTLASDDQVGHPFEKSVVTHKPLGRATEYGDWAGQLIPNALYAGGMWIAYKQGSELAYSRAELMVLGTFYAVSASTIMKYTIREGRPYNSKIRTSFPSGHTTSAFAFAGIVAAEHGWWYGVPAMMLATYTGYTRIEDHQHYLHDVVAGATVGLSYALGIYYVRKPERCDFVMVPKPLDDGAELSVAWSY